MDRNQSHLNKVQMNRRKFLTTAAVAGTLLLLPRAHGIALAAEPTLEETVAWLREKLLQDPGWSNPIANMKYTGVLLTEKTIYFTIRCDLFPNETYKETEVLVIHVPLDKMKSTRGSYPTGRRIVFHCTGGENNVPRQNVTKRTEQMRSQFEVNVDNEELAKRVAKALTHAIKLCGGKDTSDEPF